MSLFQLSFALPAPIAANLHWWLAGVIVLGGLLLFGRNELIRLQFRRVLAISDVCFAESVRRKVLLVIPLAILGVIAVTFLQHPIDQQEAIRQTIKFCLFACGTIVTVTAIILAATNLPREIENRVIFTIATKPTTRLEIVLGKILGFMRVSGVIVLVMGIFTLAFLEWQNWQLSRQVAERLQSSDLDPGTRRTLEGYRDAGLLKTRSLEQPEDFQIFSHFYKGEGPQWVEGGGGFAFMVPFTPDHSQQGLLEAATEEPPRAHLLVINTMHLRRRVPNKEDLHGIETRRLPMEQQIFGPTLPGAQTQPMPIPQLSVDILDAQRETLVPANQINGGKYTDVPRPNPDGSYSIATPISAENIRPMLDASKFYVQVEPQTPSVDFQVTATPTVLLILDEKNVSHLVAASGLPHFVSHIGRYGMQIAGNPNGDGSVADFHFEHVAVPHDAKTVELRFRAGIVRGGDYDPNKPWSLVRMKILNRDTGKITENIDFHPETNRDIPVPVPAEYVEGGNFDVYIQGLDSGQWVGMSPTSVQLISAEHTFIVNLLKSLLLLWLFSILVVVVAVFCSTFLSWPIAIVLTLVVLLGHWGVTQLGDALHPGVGRGVATDLGFGRDAAQSQVISTSVDSLAKMLTAVSGGLPDLSKFPVMDDITRGVSIPSRNILEALGVLLYYGLPMLVLSFIILKNKEVAP